MSSSSSQARATAQLCGQGHGPGNARAGGRGRGPVHTQRLFPRASIGLPPLDNDAGVRASRLAHEILAQRDYLVRCAILGDNQDVCCCVAFSWARRRLGGFSVGLSAGIQRRAPQCRLPIRQGGLEECRNVEFGYHEKPEGPVALARGRFLGHVSLGSRISGAGMPLPGPQPPEPRRPCRAGRKEMDYASLIRPTGNDARRRPAAARRPAQAPASCSSRTAPDCARSAASMTSSGISHSDCAGRTGTLKSSRSA